MAEDSNPTPRRQRIRTRDRKKPNAPPLPSGVRVTATEERDWKREVLELWDTLDEIKNSSSDRLCAIVAVAHLDDSIQRGMIKRLIDDPKLIKSQISPGGALIDLKSKSEIAYLLGLSSRHVVDTILLLGQIRNQFAHNARVRSFENSILDKFFNKLDFLDRKDEVQALLISNLQKDRDFTGYSRRERFIAVAELLGNHFFGVAVAASRIVPVANW